MGGPTVVRVSLPDSIGPDDLKVAALAVMAALAILTFVISAIVTKIAIRVVVIGVFAASVLFLYSQRDDLDQCQKDVRATMTSTSVDVRCTCTFAGFDVTVPRCPLVRQPGG